MILAFTGRAGSGKSTAARGVLEALPTAEEFAFAGALKETARHLFGLTTRQLYGDEKELVDPRWGTTPRRILQRLGNGARTAHPDVWVRHLFEREIPDHGPLEHVVISDVRYPNELAAVRARGGVVVRIVRPGLARWPWLRSPLARRVLLGEHASEAAIDSLPVDHEIVNDGTVADLQRVVVELLYVRYCVGKALLAG